jgi:nucleoside 2-deoxyribosyltransferase
MKCHFCSIDLGESQAYSDPSSYRCPICGDVYLEEEAAQDIWGERFNKNQKNIIGTCIRNEWERRGRKKPSKRLSLGDLWGFIRQYRRLDSLEKMDNALLNLEKASQYVGHIITVNTEHDYLYYHCSNTKELTSILRFLGQMSLVNAIESLDPHKDLSISPKGYQRLLDLKKHKDSRQAFVAMWLSSEMNQVYENAIKPAIEYIEDAENEPRYKALRIDNKEHTNDINDEIIAEIRRSRFMVCDLTGYRGGVYFEAGFAYGLGLEVIYTCRKDWIKKDTLKDLKGKAVDKLMDSYGNEIEVNKEGIHFDLEHRNRIEWEETNLQDFKDRLTNRIKAVVL